MTKEMAAGKGYALIKASVFEVGLLQHGRGIRTWWLNSFGGKMPELDDPLVVKAIAINEEEEEWRRRSAFTLVELMVVIGIFALLAAIAVPNLVGVAEGSKVGVVTSIEWNGSRWHVDVSQQGVRRIQPGKTSYLQENIWSFWMPPTVENNAMAEKIKTYQGHVLRFTYHRQGAKTEVKAVDDLGLAEQP